MVKLAKRLVVGNARGDGWREGEEEKAFPCHAKIGQVAPGLWRQPSTVLYSMRQERIDGHYSIFKPQWQCIFNNDPGKKVPPLLRVSPPIPPTSKYLLSSLCADWYSQLPSTIYTQILRNGFQSSEIPLVTCRRQYSEEAYHQSTPSNCFPGIIKDTAAAERNC